MSVFAVHFSVVFVVFRLAREQVALSFVILSKACMHFVELWGSHENYTYQKKKRKTTRSVDVVFFHTSIWWLFVSTCIRPKKKSMHFAHFCDCNLVCPQLFFHSLSLLSAVLIYLHCQQRFFFLSLSIEVAYFSHPLNDIACVQRTRYDFQWLSVLCLQNLHWPHIFGVVKVPIKHGVEFFFSTMQKIDHLFQCLFKLE